VVRRFASIHARSVSPIRDGYDCTLRGSDRLEDADEFMQRLFEAFDLGSGDYDFHRYFLMEGEWILYHLMTNLIRKRHTFTRETLTVGVLHRALIDGRWESHALSQWQQMVFPRSQRL